MAICLSGGEIKTFLEQLYRLSEGIDGGDIEIFVYGNRDQAICEALLARLKTRV